MRFGRWRGSFSWTSMVLAFAVVAGGPLAAAASEEAADVRVGSSSGRDIFDPTDPRGACIYLGGPYPDLVHGLLFAWCETYVTAWIFIWYYPPGPYQAYCIAKSQIGEPCPTPDPGGSVLAVA